MDKWVCLVFASAWTSCGLAVCAGLYFTGQPYCLFAMALPLFISYKGGSDDKK